MPFKKVDQKQSFPKMEEEILKFWDEKKIFEKSLENRKGASAYSFYDGPPFATGTPHYGHLVGSIMKDVVPRYWTMRGRYVERKWGWDCHGLPIENIAEKALGIKHKKEIEEMGVEKFNEYCRSTVLQYVDDWKKVITRLGRWADMENSYKTMDLPYMESVWWVFKQLWDKGLIYEGYRVMHVCTRCETTLSQQEISEGYKDIKDLSAIAKFELVDELGTFVLAWTTTPWTLIGNVALAVGEDIEYIKISKPIKRNEKGAIEYEKYILAKAIYEKINQEGTKNQLYIDLWRNSVLPDEVGKEINKIEIDIFKGKDLVGKNYKPLFDYYFHKGLQNEENGWKIYAADFVTTDEGTGVVHIAPAFGEDDFNLSKKYALPFVQHVGMDGIIKKEAGEFAGLSVKPQEDHQKTDIEIIKYLAKNNLLFAKEKYEHSYPHCWRCDTPLINYATSSWFVKVTDIKDKALELAKDINWSPAHIKEGRFGNWLEGARDWSISRQRYWASVIPIWKCECGEIKVIGSIDELEKLSGEKIIDIHKHIVDSITLKCEKCGGEMKRIPDVLDTWFDSGSMPYAQAHYPFENKEKFDAGFPAEFIAEGVDQTRAWFYYLHVIATSIKESKAFNNVIVNGIVLAEDGKKMSKRLQNYPDPSLIFEKYGADALRLYLMSSPVVAADNLNFKESDVADLIRGVFRMLWNSYSFFVLYADIDGWKPNDEKLQPSNLLDKWIVSELNFLIGNVNMHMEAYELHKAARLLPKFIDNLSNWYIRRSRKRFWKSENDTDKNEAYATLHYVLVELSKLMAPFTPFMAEEIYRNLTGKESVHLDDYPFYDLSDMTESEAEERMDKGILDMKLNNKMEKVRDVISSGLQLRAQAKRKVRQPLSELQIVLLTSEQNQSLGDDFDDMIKEELNVKKITYKNQFPDYKIEGGQDKSWVESEIRGLHIFLKIEVTPELRLEGQAREVIRFIQEMRKEAGFEVDNRIKVCYSGLSEVFEKFGNLVAKETLAEAINSEKIANADLTKESEIDGEKIILAIKKVI